MSKNIEQIHEFQFNQRLNILKGFKEVSGMAPLPIEDLRKSLGDEPLYTSENLEKYTKDVLIKGNETDIQKAKEVLNSLSCREVIDENGYVQNMYFYIEKGLPNSTGAGGNGLVKKQITDKTGKNTTKWIKPGEDDKKEGNSESSDNSEVESETADTDETSANPKVQEHAKNTSTEDLKAFLQKDPDSEHADHAKAELDSRGETNDGGEPYTTPDADSLDSYYAMDEVGQKAVLQASFEHNIPLKAAMAMVNSSSSDNSETHAAIDGAQAAIDALKEKTGHPGVAGEDGQSDEEPGKTTENTKDLVNEHKDLVNTLESDSHEDDKEEAVKQKKELGDLEEEQDNDGHDDDGDGSDEDDTDSEDDDEIDEDAEERGIQYDKDDNPENEDASEDEEDEAKSEIIKQDLEDSFSKLDDIVGDENFNITDSQNNDSDYSKVLNYVADLVEEYEIDENTFNEISKKFKGLDLVYSDFSRD
jgi:segregation and condensation protein B